MSDRGDEDEPTVEDIKADLLYESYSEGGQNRALFQLLASCIAADRERFRATDQIYPLVRLVRNLLRAEHLLGNWEGLRLVVDNKTTPTKPEGFQDWTADRAG